MLFSQRSKVWKLTDFGISAEATSKKAHTTRYARGSDSYRAPELLEEHPTFTNKVDMWALGCILYELVTGKATFKGYLDVLNYALDPKPNKRLIEVPFPETEHFPTLFQSHVNTNVRLLLGRSAPTRPSAADVRRIFNFHCQFLSLENANEIIAVSSYPSYLEWKSICETHKTSELDRLYALANLYEQNGEDAAARSLKTPLIRQEAERRYQDRQSQGIDSSKLECLAEILVERKDYASAITTYADAIEKEPENFWLWHGLCRVYVERDGIQGAIALCTRAFNDNLDHSRSLPCLIELVCLYAAANDYATAELAVDLFWEQCKYIARQGDLRKIVVETLKLKITLPDETRYHARPCSNSM